MKFLITGASGFVGQNFSMELLKKYGNNKNEFIFISGKRELDFLKEFNSSKITIIKADISNSEDLKNIFYLVDIVFHLAAKVEYGALDVENYYKINVNGTKNVLEEAYASSVKKVFYLSSAAIYHPQGDVAINENSIQNNHVTHYSKSKFIAQGVIDLYRKRGVDIDVIFPSSVFGYKAPLFNSFLKLLFKYHIVVLPRKKGKLSFILNDELSLFLVSLVEKNIKNRNYLLSSNTFDLIQLVEKIEKELGIKVLKIKIPNIFLKFMTLFFTVIFKIFKKRVELNYELFKFLNGNFIVDSNLNKNIIIKQRINFEKEFIKIINKYHSNDDAATI